MVRFYNRRGTAEQHIREGKHAFRRTRLSCKRFRDNEVRLQLNAPACNLATFLRCIERPKAMADRSLTSLRPTSRRKKLDQLAGSDDLAVKRQATWEMSAGELAEWLDDRDRDGIRP